MKSHIGRHHKGQGDSARQDRDEDQNIDEEHDHYVQHWDDNPIPIELDEDRVDGHNVAGLQYSAASFLLRMRERHHLSQTGIADLVIETDTMIRQFNDVKKRKLLTIPDLTEEQISDVERIMLHNTAFEDLETIWKQGKFFKERIGLVEPRECILGQRLVPVVSKNQTVFKLKPAKGYYIPLAENVKALLSTSEIHAVIPDDSTVGMKDIMDGQYVKTHPFFISHPDALGILLFVDDFEITNPIGTHVKKHKLTNLHYQVCNIPPQYRSKLSAIQLAAVALSEDIRTFGYSVILKNFIDDLKLFYDGHDMVVRGVKKRFYAGLVAVTADTLAAQHLGGFKLGVGGAHCPCRTCEVRKEELRQSFAHEDFPERDEQEHLDRCDMLESACTDDARNYWSKQYGINNRSILTEIPGFKITKCMFHDPMHVIFEGLAPMIVKALLSLCINEKLFSLKDFNDQLSAYPCYSANELKDKPMPLSEKTMRDPGHTLKQTAQSMKHLLVILPFIFDGLIDWNAQNWQTIAPHWHHFLLLQKIMYLVTSPTLTEDGTATLKILITEHNQLFNELYPDLPFTPKMHYLTHLPNQISKFGPAKFHSCMRFEAKHGLFKGMRWKNFKNLPKSVALRHQRWMCYMQCDSRHGVSNNYLNTGDEVTIPHPVPLPPEQIMRYEFILPEGEVFHTPQEATKVVINGFAYSPGTILVMDIDVASDVPVFAEITNILVDGLDKYFVLQRRNIRQFNDNLCAFALDAPDDGEEMVLPAQLKFPWPQARRDVGQAQYVVLAYCGVVPSF